MILKKIKRNKISKQINKNFFEGGHYAKFLTLEEKGIFFLYSRNRIAE